MSAIGKGFTDALRRPQFVVGAVILALAVAGLRAAVAHFQVVFRKQPVPLRLALDRLDKAAVGPEYEVVASHALSPELIQELGTDQYVSWRLRAAGKPADDPKNLASLFVTYYTGDPDQVPHVPDVCYLGSGFQTVDDRVLPLGVAVLGETVPIRCLSFRKQAFGSRQDVVVLYLFNVNGQFRADRDRVRVVLANPLARYAYFSKVELSFVGSADDEVMVETGLALLRKVLPELARSHWPDWQTVTAGTREGEASPSQH